ncbi:hypothetical protein FI667_g13067, partial [Globisporangium splendens]
MKHKNGNANGGRHSSLHARASGDAIAAAAGANWKSSAVVTHARKTHKLPHASKKVSGGQRAAGTRHAHVITASPKKKHKQQLRRQQSFKRGHHAFPRNRKDVGRTAPSSDEEDVDARAPSAVADSLDAEIEAFVRFVSLSATEKAVRTTMFNDMKALICGTFANATVQLYGSSSNGLDTFRSDMDITVGNITLSDSLRSDVHHAMTDNQEVENEKEGSDQDESDYEDERYPSAAPAVEPVHDVRSEIKAEDEEETSFSLNIAMPGSSSSASPSRLSDAFFGYGSNQTASSSSVAKSPWNPTLRRKKIRVLRALQYLLNVKRPQYHVKCLQKAKIPILMVFDPESQLNMDIGINRESFASSDHGKTTSLVIVLQQVLGKSFMLLVTFLKEFLHQFELDKPFTGGLGSFRLYIMVASLFPLEKKGNLYVQVVRSSREPPPSVSTLLLVFLERFGNKKNPNYFHNQTVLTLPLFGADSTVEFSSVFRINDCVDSFAMAHDVLIKTKSLGSILFEEKLADERQQARELATATIQTQKASAVSRGGNGARRKQ